MNYLNITRRMGKNIRNISSRRPAILFTNILLTYRCTQRCLQCTIPAMHTAETEITLSDFTHIIDKLDRYGTQGISLSGGEPMCHPQLASIIEIAAKKHFINTQILTTLYGSEKMVEKTIRAVFDHDIALSCSFDGFGEVANVLRGVKDVSHIVKNNILAFHEENKKRKKPVKTYLNIVLSQLNLHQVPEILDFAEQIGWRLNVDLYRWASDNHQEQEQMKIIDFDLLTRMIELSKKSKIVITPNWLLDGYVDFLNDDFQKICPYLDNPLLGSKFFIHPNGDLKVCIGPRIGNLLEDSLPEIFKSNNWYEKKTEFENCAGCWNTCYTPSAKISNYFNTDDINIIRKISSRKVTLSDKLDSETSPPR